MKFDDVLEEVGGFGRFQFQMFFLMVIPRLILPFNFLLNNFISYIPSHHCNASGLDDGGEFSGLTQQERLVVSIPFQEDGTLNSCQMFAEPQYHLLLNSSNITKLPTVACRNGWVYDNTTFKSTLATEWDLVCDKKSINRATVTIFFMGVMLGSAVFGYLSDRFGRKRILLLSFVTTALFGFASALSYNFTMFAVMRFFTGFGAAGITMITVVNCVEWVDIKHRPTMIVLLSLDWSLGGALLALVAYLLPDWRHLTAAATAPLLPAMIVWRWLPESARWLMSNGNVNSAHFYLCKCAKVNRRDQFMAAVKPEILSKIILVEKENRKYSYLDLMRNPGMRRLSALAGLLWFGVAGVYYGISLNIRGFGVNIYLTQFIYSLSEIPAKLFIVFTLEKVGRRFNQAGSLFLTGLCVVCTMIIPQDKGPYRSVVAALGKMFGEASFTMVYLYTTEIYPTVLRQNGLGFCCFLARVGVAISPMILLAEDVWVHLPGAIFCLLAFAAGFSALLLPETQDVRLPETMEDVEQRPRAFASLQHSQ